MSCLELTKLQKFLIKHINYWLKIVFSSLRDDLINFKLKISYADRWFTIDPRVGIGLN